MSTAWAVASIRIVRAVHPAGIGCAYFYGYFFDANRENNYLMATKSTEEHGKITRQIKVNSSP
jgi:hypothetical protein